MRRLPLSLAIAAALSMGAATLATAPLADTVTPVAGAVSASEITGTVEVVNTETRLMTIRTPDGRFEVMHIPPQVERINQIKIGDKVSISETETVLVDVETGRDAGAMGAMGDTTVDREPGRKPAGTLVDTMKLYGKVESVDKAKSQVTVRGPNNVVTLNVKDPAILAKLKPGDGVIATYVRTITGKVEAQ
jgi:Cu/Ag efflux protein CusF